jgi:uncharacterized protein YggT (Ycf19 family)
MNKNLSQSFIFVLLFFGMLWLMPDMKVENIGDFLEKIVTPLSVPLSAIILYRLGILKYREIKKKKDEDT